MKTIPITPKKNQNSADVSEYILEAFYWARSFKEEAQNVITQTDRYFIDRENVPDAWIGLCDDSSSCGSNGAFVHIDAISTKIDAFMAISSDAVIQVDKPWIISPTKIPKIDDKYKDEMVDTIVSIVGEKAAELSNGDKEMFYEMLTNILKDEEGAYDIIRGHRDSMMQLIKQDIRRSAIDSANEFDDIITDDIEESNFKTELNEFIYNMAKYDFAVIKAPMHTTNYVETVENGFVVEKAVKSASFSNIHPSNYYCSQDSTWSNCGTFEIDVSTINLNDLSLSKNYDGFVSTEIDNCIDFFMDTNREWLDEDYDKSADCDNWRDYEHLPVVKYYGKIPSRIVFDNCTESQKREIKNSAFSDNVSFESEVWVIGEYVIYNVVKLSNIIRRPFKVVTYSKRGRHKYEGKGIYSLCINHQMEMDKFYNMMLENADLAAGGIIGYDRKKIAAKTFSSSDIRGGARIPVKSSIADGGNNRPIFEIRFDSHVSEFFGIIAQIEAKMDRDSQIPSSAIGFGSKISSIRSTGIASIDQANINKGVISKMMAVESQLITPMIKDAISYHLWNTTNKAILSGAVDVKVSGYSEIIRKQSKQQNLDMFIQNIIGIQNAINTMKAQGQDVSGIIGLVKRYTDQAGFDSSDFFSDSYNDVAGSIAGNVSSPVPQQILNDGRVGISPPSESQI